MMPLYRFVAVTPGNERREGVLEAPAMADAAAALMKTGLFVVRVAPESRARAFWALLNRDVAFAAPLKPRDLVALTLEWAGLLEAGVPLEEALALSSGDGRAKGLARVTAAVRAGVTGGASLAEALKAHPRCFPPVYVALVQAGEASGAVGPALRRLAADLEARRDFVEKIRGALLYPAFLVVTAGGAIVVLLAVVVPNLESLISEQAETTLPFATRAVMALSHALRDHGVTAAATVALAAAAALLAARAPRVRRRLDRAVLRLPVAGALVRSAEAGRYLRTLSALVGGGVPLPRALPLALPALGNRALAADIAAAHARVLVGASLGDALSDSRALPPDALVLARIGERTGKLADALGAAANILETTVRRRLEALATLIGPLLTVAFGLAAGLIVYAMLATILGVNELAYQ